MSASTQVVPLFRKPPRQGRCRPKPPPPSELKRAAQYVRMSTDMQVYSTANQRDAIAAYAQKHGLEVVRTYIDEGRSGLSVAGRDGLNRLLADVATGSADYATILVYDVSRWGRFQDCDESAFYEYLCRRSGIQVVYCMEPFPNDGTPISAVMKNLKRVMAGEFSRELSQKVFFGKCRGTRLGFRQGAMAGFGLRRMVVDPSGKPRAILQHGEHKAVNSDRVVLVPGPPEEVAELRNIFRNVARGMKPTETARDLTARRVPTPEGRPWDPSRILSMVTNERYLGNLIFNRTSTRLKTPIVHNSADKWVRMDGAFEPVVDARLFRRAQAAIARWGTRITKEEAIRLLKQLYDRHGWLTADLIDATPGMPSSHFYDQRFGGMMAAYALVGFTADRRYRHMRGYGAFKRQADQLRAEIVQRFKGRAAVERLSRYVIAINDIEVMVLLSSHRVGSRGARWTARRRGPAADWMLVARRTPDGSAIQDYCVVPGRHRCAALGDAKHRSLNVWYAGPDLGQVLDAFLDPVKLTARFATSDQRRPVRTGTARS